MKAKDSFVERFENTTFVVNSLLPMASDIIHDIFICHSSKDSSIALALYDFLRSEGFLPWMAPQDVPPGHTYASAIVDAAGKCSVMLVLLSAHSSVSEHVLNEVELAIRKNKRLIPVLIENAPVGDELGYYLNRIQWIDLTGGGEHPFQPLLVGLKQQLQPHASDGMLHSQPEGVDLGLSVKWATFNLGAATPHNPGQYFAWGEVASKENYSERDYQTTGQLVTDISAQGEYDAARAIWGGTWRLPTVTEARELVEKCRWTWEMYGTRGGYVVASNVNGNSIFLPAAGKRNGRRLSLVGENGGYWTSTPVAGRKHLAYDFIFGSAFHQLDWNRRYIGLSIRPVLG